MSSSLNLKRWETVSYFPQGTTADPKGGPEITMELKRLKRNESRELRKLVVLVLKELEKATDADLTSSQKADIMRQVYDVVPEEDLVKAFGYVRNVKGLEIDGQPLTDGEALLNEADDDLLFFTLMRLQSLSGLAPVETFRSASRSTSSAETARQPEPPVSDATSTGNGDGIAPSTATETPTESPLSSVLAVEG